MKSAADAKKATVTEDHKRESERLKALWVKAGKPDQSELGRKFGAGQSAVSNMLNGHMAITINAARVFAKEFGCDIREFSLRLGADAAKTAEVVRVDDADGFADIKRTVRVSGGHGSIPSYEEESGSLKFRRDFLRSVGVTEARAVTVTVKGHSMEPTIPDGATLLVNKSNREPQQGKFYVFWKPDEGLVVKRIVKENGRWIARSDNDDRAQYPDFEFAKDQTLLGRAVWMGVKL